MIFIQLLHLIILYDMYDIYFKLPIYLICLNYQN